MPRSALGLALVSLACTSSGGGAPVSPPDAGPVAGAADAAAPKDQAPPSVDMGMVATPPPGVCVKGAISVNTLWPAKQSPISVCGTVTVSSGATLTIEPGTTLEIDAGFDIVVASGGRLIAEGMEGKKITFTRPAGKAVNWGHVVVNGDPASPETRIAWAELDFNAMSAEMACVQVTGGTVFLDHLTFGNPASPYVHLDGASFIVSNTAFPTPTAKFEPMHGTGGIKAGGHGIVTRCFFGAPNGYDDVVDFTGGNRPNEPIVHFIDNVFSGGDDDLLDLDGTDAWVEGNVFLHAHKNRGTPDSSTAVSGGSDSNNTSEITIIGNVMYDCDGAMDAKQGNFYVFIDNTVVHQNHMSGDDVDGAVVVLADMGTTEGAGVYLEGNILFDIEKLTRNQTKALVTFTSNLMPLPWAGPGMGNSTADPRFKHVPQLAETTAFTSWMQAQVVRDWFSLQADSPGKGTGPNGRDKGGVVPIGASIFGEPSGATTQTTAMLTVGPYRTGNGIPAAGWPNGAGYTHYKWRLDGGAWSPETSSATPIALTGLAPGAHYVEVTGKRDSGLYQDDPMFGADALVTRSRTWTVMK